MRRFVIGIAAWLWMATGAFAGVSCTLPFNLQNGTTADATQVMANYNALVACLGNAASAGANTDITALLGLTTPITPAEGGSNVYIGVNSTGSANAQIVTATTPTNFALQKGYSVVFVAGFSNTGPTTLNVNSTGSLNIYFASASGPAALKGGEIVAGQMVVAQYDGTRYQLLSNGNAYGGVGPQTSITSATTTDLATAAFHNALITGTTTITSFGSNATTDHPVYWVTFNGSLTLTYNATSMLLPGAGNIVTQANDTALVQYLGTGNWQVVSYQRANGTAVVNPTPMCGAQGLTIANNSGTPNNKIDIAASQVVMINPTGNVPIYRTAVSVTINDTINGANGLDAGSLTTNTFYYHYLIDNGSVTAGLDSLSATAPTMPSGYIYRCLLGATKTNGSSNFYGTMQLGNVAQYVSGGANLTTLPAIHNNATVGSSCTSVGTPTWAAQTIRGASGAAVWIPSITSAVQLVGGSTGANSGIAAAPNTSYGTYGATNLAPLYFNQGASLPVVPNVITWMQLEADTIQTCAVSGFLNVVAYRMNINAN